MKRGLVYFIIGLLAGIPLYYLLTPFILSPSATPVFSPEDDGHAIIGLIDGARSSIDVEMYVMTSQEVMDALERARARGVTVHVILERNVMDHQNDAAYSELAGNGIAVRYASRAFDLTHSKFMIIDGNVVLVGSINFSNAALHKNREAAVVLRDPASVSRFLSVFEHDWNMAS